MRITYGQWEWSWHLRLLPSIEYSNYRRVGLDEHYGHRYELTFRWLPYWVSVEIGGVK